MSDTTNAYVIVFAHELSTITMHISTTVMRIIKLKIFPVPVRLHYGYGKLICVIISHFFAIFNNVVHSLEPGETPIYPGVSPGSKLCTTFINIANHFKTVVVRLRLIFQFTYVQYCMHTVAETVT